jgi:signal transduction histidine kinase
MAHSLKQRTTVQDFQAVANRLLTLALTQHSSQDFVRETLAEALRATDGLRAFLARIEQETGELILVETAGRGWNDKMRRIRLQPHNETQRGITGYVAITGEPYLTGDVLNDIHYLKQFDDVRSEVAVPFFDAEGRVRGILSVDSDRPDHFHHEHLVHLTTFANAIAAALAIEEYRSRERLLVEIGLDLAATTEIEPLVRRVIEVAAEVLECEACSIFLLDEPSQTLVLKAARGNLRKRVGEATYRLGEGLTGTIGLTGETIRLDDPREDPRWRGRYPEFSPDELSAFLAVPILGRNRILGVIRVSRPRSAPAWFRARFTENDERMLRTIGSQLGTAIENVRSFNQLVRTERMAAWGELSAKSAHMIGNRTFAIKGDLNELKYLLSQCADPQALAGRDMRGEIDALVESIERGVFRLEEILREFRDFVMATQLNLAETDINRVVKEAVSETFPRRSAIRLQQTYTPDLPVLRYDAGKLKRAFSELVENAVSFMPEGGVLQVGTAPIEPGQGPSFARLSPTRRYVQIEIADTGPGVPTELKGKIFTPFFSSRAKGMGLGLSIVKGIVDAHHGVIREEGEPGHGARFLIYLPINGEKHKEGPRK